MGQASSTDRPADCDLDDETIEEIRMTTALPPKEIYRLRRKFRELAAGDSMSKAEFLAIPDLLADASISFHEFARFAHVFSYHSSRDVKLREAFRLHDFDGDGRLSASDLREYLALVYQPATDDDTGDTGDTGEAETARHEMIEIIVARVLDEASSAPTKDSLAFDDFAKVLRATDFESRLTIQI